MRDANPVHVPLYPYLSCQNSKPVVIYKIFPKEKIKRS